MGAAQSIPISGHSTLGLSPAAQHGFTEILRYSGESWTRARLLADRDKLDDALLLLADHPDIGHRTGALSSTHRLYAVGAHVIVYRVRGHAPEVVGMLHQRIRTRAPGPFQRG